MHKKYPVILSDAERADLQRLIAAGTALARHLTHGRILLKADQSPVGSAWDDQVIADALEISLPTVSRIRKQYVADPQTVHRTRTHRLIWLLLSSMAICFFAIADIGAIHGRGAGCNFI